LDQVEDAAEFARGVLALYPGQMLAYNLSPSFNWEKAGMTDEVCHHNDPRKIFTLPRVFYPKG
jgi:isocitrate lyase